MTTAQEIDESAEFTALCDQTLVGWQRFNEQNRSPDKVMGLLYDGFVMPPREALGDADPAQWEEGLAGEPQDPWQRASSCSPCRTRGRPSCSPFRHQLKDRPTCRRHLA